MFTIDTCIRHHLLASAFCTHVSLSLAPALSPPLTCTQQLSDATLLPLYTVGADGMRTGVSNPST